MTALLLADDDGQSLLEATARALSAVRVLSDDVHVLVAGANRAIAEQAAGLQGVTRVLLLEGDAAIRRAEPLGVAILGVAGHYDVIAAPATSLGRDVMPRVAALLDVTQISNVVAAWAPDRFARSLYSGTVTLRVQALDAIKVFTARASAFPPAASGQSRAPIEVLQPPLDTHGSEHIRFDKAMSTRADLQTARVVVGGGRALASDAQFDALLAPLADALGGALAASRAAVDAGYAPSDWRVGQTGKIIAPDLYIACGISGAVQHIAGIKDARTIVAINKDPDAPIFQIADFGIVGDLFEIVPQLVAELSGKSR